MNKKKNMLAGFAIFAAIIMLMTPNMTGYAKGKVVTDASVKKSAEDIIKIETYTCEKKIYPVVSSLKLEVIGATDDSGKVPFLGISIIGPCKDYRNLEIRATINCWNEYIPGASIGDNILTRHWRLRPTTKPTIVHRNSAELWIDNDWDGKYDQRLHRIYFIIIQIGAKVYTITTPIPM